MLMRMQENHEDNEEIIIDQTELHHTVHIFGCKNSTVRVSGKINAVAMGQLPSQKGLGTADTHQSGVRRPLSWSTRPSSDKGVQWRLCAATRSRKLLIN